MTEKIEPTGNESQLPRRGFMAKAGAVTAALAVTPLLPRPTLASGVGTPAPKAGTPKPGTPIPALKIARPKLSITIRVPDDVDVTTSVQKVSHKFNFAETLHGVSRRATIDLTTSKAGQTLRDPGSMADDDTCCCVRG